MIICLSVCFHCAKKLTRQDKKLFFLTLLGPSSAKYTVYIQIFEPGRNFHGRSKIQGFRDFIFEDHLQPTFVLYIHCDCFLYNLEDFIFVDNKLPAKQ